VSTDHLHISIWF